MKKAGEHVRVNFGQSPFIFDIDGMMSASNHNFITSHSVSPHIPFPGSAASAGDLALDGISESSILATTLLGPGSASANGDSHNGLSAGSNHAPHNGTLVENTHLPRNETFAETNHPRRTGTPTERSQTEIQLALRHEWGSDGPNLLGNLQPSAEHAANLSRTMYRLLRRYRIYTRTAPERRRRVLSMIRERLNNERLSRILQVRVSEDGALDLFRTIRTEILYEIALNNEWEGFLAYPEPRSRSQSPRTIVVLAESRRETMRVMRRALDMVNRPISISYNASSRGRQPETQDRFTQSPAPSLEVAISPRTQARAISILRSSSPDFRNCLISNIWTNFREQSEKKHIRQEIEATSIAKLAPPLGETELIQSLVSHNSM
jgi:hypothetical protein